MQKLAGRLILLWGWRRALMAFVVGAASALAFAPFNILPLMFVSLTLLVWLIDGIGSPGPGVSGKHGGWASGLGAAFVIGWSFGFGFFLAGLYWIGAAFLVEAEQFAVFLPLAIVALPAGLALFYGGAVALAWVFWSQGGARIFALAFAFAGADWLRGHILTGFPWNLIGHSLTGYMPLIQGVAYIGAYGMTLLAVVICASPATLGTPDPGKGQSRLVMPVLGLILFVALILVGVQRTARGPDQLAMVPDVRLRIVQPNVAQEDKWQLENRSRIFADLVNLSDRATSPGISGVRDVTHVIWPETAPPFLLDETPEALSAIAAMLPDGTGLVTGAIRREPSGSDTQRVFNSILVVDSNADILDRYDKVRLVPFGEYLPFRSLLQWLGFEQLTRVRTGFSTGSAGALLDVPGLPPALPLICYEVIFGGQIVDPARRPGVILNVTNDAWFGISTGPYQHLQQARIRAVEEGVPLVRAANTGISAIVDPFGRVLQSLPLGIAGVIDTGLPEALPPTIYARYGDRIMFALLALAGLIGFIGRRLENRSHRPSNA